MTVSNFDKQNPLGIYVRNVGLVHSPFLEKICKVGYKIYQFSITYLLMTPKEFFELKFGEDNNPYTKLSDDEKEHTDMFQLLTNTETDRVAVATALSFFIDGKIEWDVDHNAFVIDKVKTDNGFTVGGFVNSTNYDDVANICLQMINVQYEKPVSSMKFRQEQDKKFYEHFMKQKEKAAKNKKYDPDFDLDNMVSAVCTYHNSLNYTNIYKLTVFQLHDTFSRLIKKKQYDVMDANYATWGGKEHDMLGWMHSDDKNKGGN